MNLSTPTPLETPAPSVSTTLDSSRGRVHDAVIENDWVPAIQLSSMHHAEPVQIAGPLRVTWYVANAKKLLFKVVRPKRQTV